MARLPRGRTLLWSIMAQNLSMANTGLHTKGSFFIIFPLPRLEWLNGRYVASGKEKEEWASCMLWSTWVQEAVDISMSPSYRPSLLTLPLLTRSKYWCSYNSSLSLHIFFISLYIQLDYRVKFMTKKWKLNSEQNNMKKQATEKNICKFYVQHRTNIQIT